MTFRPVPDVTYSGLIGTILKHGETRTDRTGVGTKSLFGAVCSYSLDSFPILVGKEVKFKSVLSELLWFLSGSTNDKDLAKLNGSKKTIWTDNAEAPYWKHKASKPGDLGQIYGYQWRKWAGRDQIRDLEKGLSEDPFSRRHMLQSYGPNQIGTAALPACHCMAQFYVHVNGTLDCMVYIRSNDMFLGHPYNMTSYALLTYMLAHVHGFTPGNLLITIGDAHVYLNHMEAIREYRNRDITKLSYPGLQINSKPKSILDFKMEDFELVGYKPLSAIPAPMAV